MENISVQFRGIERQLPYQESKDGSLGELINLRRYKGRLEPVGYKPLINSFNLSGKLLIAGWVHEMDDESVFLVQDSAFNLYEINIESGNLTLIKAYSGSVRIEFLKLFMIVNYNGGMDRFVRKESAYVALNISVRPKFSVYKSSEAVLQSVQEELTGDTDEIAVALRGEYYKQLNDKSNDGYFTGSMFVRAAFRLFDGSYIMHTIPQIISVNNFEIGIKKPSSAYDYLYSITATFSKLNIILPTELFTSFSNMKDIISHVVLFASKMETVIKWDESIDDNVAAISGLKTGKNITYYLNTYITDVNNEYKKLNDSASWYNIGEWSLSSILEADINEEVDLKGFYQDYATRETLTIDSFSHHELSGQATFNYNSRFIIGNIKSKFGKYTYYPLQPDIWGVESSDLITYITSTLGYVGTGGKTVKIITTMNISGKEITVSSESVVASSYAHASFAGKTFIPIALGQFGYPDARATKVEILINTSPGVWQKCNTSIALTKSNYDNFAYYIDSNFNTTATGHIQGTVNFPLIMFQYESLNIVDIDNYSDVLYQDSNRVQISEVNNPFFFPAKNSYQVGTGQITDIAANTEPLSVGQFGEMPLEIFEDNMIWAMVQGSGDVLFSSVVPVIGEVAIPGSVVAISSGVIYATSKGLYLLQGKQVTDLTTLVTGSTNVDFQPNVNYQFYISQSNLVQLSNSLSQTDIINYISGAMIGYDHVNKELIASNPVYSYSYIYGFESGIWFKINFSVKLLINYYPKLYAIKEISGLTNFINLSDEQKNYGDNDWYVDCLITTQPMSLGSDSFKLIRRMVLRTLHETTEGVNNTGFYLFGSSDLINWQRITGRNHISGKKRDILLQRSGSKFKYFIVVFAGKLKYDSYISGLDISFDYKANNKLR